MNSENNFNTQGNNGSFSNQQPLNNQNNNIYPNQNINQQPNYIQNNKPKKKSKLLIIVIAILVVLVIGIVVFGKLLLGKENNNEPIVVTSTFEKNGNHYALKDENGKILLDNIKSYGKFCNGTTEVVNTDGQYGIVDGSGKLVVEYGKYSSINQYSGWGGTYYCFYDATIKEPRQKVILKYDGSVLYSDENDKYLKEADLDIYSEIDKIAMLTTKDKYIILNYLGNEIISFNKETNVEEAKILSNSGKNVNDKYFTVYYNNKTYIYSLSDFKTIIKTLDGKFSIKDIYTTKTTMTIAGIEKQSEEDAVVIYGTPNVKDDSIRKTYVLDNNKLMFELDHCLNVSLENKEVKCLIKEGGVFEYYDIKGNKLNK